MLKNTLLIGLLIALSADSTEVNRPGKFKKVPTLTDIIIDFLTWAVISLAWLGTKIITGTFYLLFGLLLAAACLAVSAVILEIILPRAIPYFNEMIAGITSHLFPSSNSATCIDLNQDAPNTGYTQIQQVLFLQDAIIKNQYMNKEDIIDVKDDSKSQKIELKFKDAITQLSKQLVTHDIEFKSRFNMGRSEISSLTDRFEKFEHLEEITLQPDSLMLMVKALASDLKQIDEGLYPVDESRYPHENKIILSDAEYQNFVMQYFTRFIIPGSQSKKTVDYILHVTAINQFMSRLIREYFDTTDKISIVKKHTSLKPSEKEELLKMFSESKVACGFLIQLCIRALGIQDNREKTGDLYNREELKNSLRKSFTTKYSTSILLRPVVLKPLNLKEQLRWIVGTIQKIQYISYSDGATQKIAYPTYYAFYIEPWVSNINLVRTKRQVETVNPNLGIINPNL